MSRVRRASLPSNSRLSAQIKEDDFVDCYVVPSACSARSAAEVALEFPSWVRALLMLRNLLVMPFGLLSEGPENSEKIGMFPLRSETADEIVAGFNDRHLDFRISILANGTEVFLATWVHTHNVGGWIYLKAVMPFHVLIVRNALRRVGAS